MSSLLPDTQISCTFCGVSQHDTKKIIASPDIVVHTGLSCDEANRDLANTGTWLFVGLRVSEGKTSEIHSLVTGSDYNSRPRYLTEVRLTGLGCFPR
jgi:hypothetical protein